MEIMAEKRVACFTKYSPAGSSSRYRIFQYQPLLEKEGFSFTNYPLFPDEYVRLFYRTGKKSKTIFVKAYCKRILQLLLLKNYDIVFIEKELFPFTPYFLEVFLLLRKKKIVFDFDDAIFHNYDQNHSILIRYLLGNKIYKLVQKGLFVITGSPYLTKTLEKYNHNTIEIPTSIDQKKYTYSDTLEAKKTAAPGRSFRIGWIGSKTTSPNILMIKEPLENFQKKTNAELVLIGFDKSLANDLKGITYKVIPWSSDTEVEEMRSFDVGIMPLTDDIFNNGKCGFKLIQYMACGLPTISTPLEANVKINRNGLNLFATTQEQWEDSLVKIFEKKEYYKTVVGKNNQEIVEKFYCIQQNKKLLIDIFNKVIQS